MPKMKTHKSTSKRFRYSKGGKGKLMKTTQGKSHFRRNRPRRLRAQFDEVHPVDNYAIERRVRRLAPYLSEQS